MLSSISESLFLPSHIFHTLLRHKNLKIEIELVSWISLAQHTKKKRRWKYITTIHRIILGVHHNSQHINCKQKYACDTSNCMRNKQAKYKKEKEVKKNIKEIRKKNGTENILKTELEWSFEQNGIEMLLEISEIQWNWIGKVHWRGKWKSVSRDLQLSYFHCFIITHSVINRNFIKIDSNIYVVIEIRFIWQTLKTWERKVQNTFQQIYFFWPKSRKNWRYTPNIQTYINTYIHTHTITIMNRFGIWNKFFTSVFITSF